MRLTPSSLLTLTSIVTSSIVYTVNSAPVSPSDLALPETINGLTNVASEANSKPIWAKIEKRCHRASSKKHTSKKHTAKRHSSKKHNKKHSKKHTKKHSSKKHSSKKHTTSKKKTNKKHTTNKKKTTKKHTTKKHTTTKKKTTTKKASGSSSSSGTKYSGDGTYYTPSLGSCGMQNNENELVAALNAPQMNNPANPNLNPTCGKYVNVTGPNKQTVRVKIVDTCPPCASGDLDLSPAAFAKIGELTQGRIPITWSWA
ncbi:hypothetical protein G6F43_002603 [Rhizopus delemar]|nr:hypothetical protein G6F43_002603 [Rhizopus delemar]